jgi:hypothetical protein
MRRILLFAALLSLVGLSTAFAASFTTQAEDVASFTTQVSISVPTTQPPVPATTYFLRGPASTLPGELSLNAQNAPVQDKQIKKDSKTVQQQDEATKYHTWQTLTVAGTPLTIGGEARLYITQKNEGGSRLTAGLFSCPAAAPPASTGCAQIGPSAVGPVPSGTGFVDITVVFPNLPLTSIPVGNQLRLKIVNTDKDSAGVVVSTQDWRLQWAYNAARQARLEFGS